MRIILFLFIHQGSSNFNQASQTISLTKNVNSSGISLISGSFNQTINVLDVIQPIVVTYTGAATGLNIVGPDDEGEISQSGNNYTINASFTAAGTYSGTITTISDGGCPEVVQDIIITVNPAPVTNTVVTDTSNNSLMTQILTIHQQVVNRELLLQPMILQVQLKLFQ